MSSTTLRQWHIMKHLPPAPQRIDAGRLEALLREEGILVHRRTIQRDLVELALVFPIAVDERSKPYSWRWAEGARPPFLVGGRAGRAGVPSTG